MTTSTNKAVIHRLYHDVFTAGKLEVINELVAADYVGYDPPNTPRAMHGLAAMGQSVARMAAAFPDRRYTIDELIGEGDLVAARVTLTATHTGQFFDTAPTGQRIAITGTIIYRFISDKIATSWGNWDNLGLMRQLGLLA
ncbi:MAG TPA: ester cyclase [Thermomicrobiales bacterium]